MAGYSGTPLARKLGFKTGYRALVKNAPRGFTKTLGRLPDEVTLQTRASGRFDLALLFSTRKSEVGREFARLAGRLTSAGMLWIAWPKKSSGVTTDLAFDVVQRIGLEAGLVDTKICAVDETWSGLKFVRRLKDR